MNIPDEVIERVTGMHPDDREYPDDVRKDFHSAAEWARKEALREARDALIGDVGNVEGWVGPTEEIGAHYASVRDGLLMALETVRDLQYGALVEGDNTNE